MSMRPKTYTFDIVDPDTDGISASQSTVGTNQELLLDGAAMTGELLPVSNGGVKVSVYSASNLASHVFTVTGTDPDGHDQTETITGVNNSTVEGTKFYKNITSVAVDLEITAPAVVIVGIVDEFMSKTIPVSNRFGDPALGFQADISGTINYTVQQTMQNVLEPGVVPYSLQWQDHDTVASVTADANDNYIVPISAVRFKVNSFSAGATAKLTIQHSNQ